MVRSLALGVACALAAAGCASIPGFGPRAVADLAPTQGNTARGTVKFAQSGDRVVVEARVEGLSPGAHGFHVHEKGDCSARDGMSAGGHFNPYGKPHGAHTSPDHHAGDMPNLQAGADGVATLRVELTGVSVGSGKPDDVVGRGVIVHVSPDDYKTQPTGNAGGRLACGVVRRL